MMKVRVLRHMDVLSLRYLEEKRNEVLAALYTVRTDVSITMRLVMLLSMKEMLCLLIYFGPF